VNYISRLRGFVGSRKIPLAYATALIRDEAGRVLLQRRSDFGDAWWGLPGGVLELDETIADCCRREAHEETGLTVEPARLVGVYSSPRYDVRYPNGDKVQQITAAFECRIVRGELKPEVGEIDALEYFAPDALPRLPLWYADMLRDLAAGQEAAHFDPPEFRTSGEAESEFWALRAAFGHQPFVAAGATAFVRDEHGRVLLHRRSDTGQWALPAGSLDLGETLAATAVRETREETGLEIEPTRLVGVYSGFEIVYPNGDRLQPFSHLFECRVVGGQPQADGHESLEVAFFPPDRLPPADARFDQRIADALAGQAEAFVR
jgi:8-oxo-dGTP pyrophosphatase MutT (NUDIX family)